MPDKIMQEVWLAKDAIAKECHYKVEMLAERLRKREKSTSRRVADLSLRRRKVVTV